QTLLPLQPNITNTLDGSAEQLKKTGHQFFIGTVCKRAHSSAAKAGYKKKKSTMHRIDKVVNEIINYFIQANCC
ncbi:hypothetical protein Bpfe_003488, partial [Biomphalaria pfeifferi]